LKKQSHLVEQNLGNNFLNIENFLILDAFWCNPSKINQLNQLILELLEDDQTKFALFKKGLEDLQKRQTDLSNKISLQFAECLILCRDISVDRSGDIKILKGEIQRKIKEEVENNVRFFTYFASELYAIAADDPTKFITEEDIKLEAYSKWHESAGYTAAWAGVGAAVGSPVGAAVGSILGAFFGGTGAFPGAVLGYQAGAAAGTTLGGLVAVLTPWNKNCASKVTKQILENVAEICLAYAWAYAYYGFGNKLVDQDNPKIDIKLINKLSEQENGTKQFYQSNTIDFISATKEDIAKWCNLFFQELESR
jgi:hypothetical protein